MRVGFVGIGRLGRHLAARLLRGGYPLVVHDSRREAAAELLDLGAAWADSPAGLAAEVEVVVTCLPSPAAVAVVVEGDDGVLDGLRAGGVWIETSTNDRREVVRLAARAAECGVGTLEAPVTGGVHLAAEGALTVLVGGDDDLVRRHRPLLETFGARVLHVGPLGLASDLKAITNMLAFVHLVACGEALMLAKRAGVELGVAHEAIAASSGTSFVHETEGQVILSGSYDIGFTLDLALKDLGLALELGRESGVPLALATLVASEFARAREVYGGAAWSPMVVKLLEDAVGEELRAPGFPTSLVP